MLHTAHVAHQMKGRMRLKIPAAKKKTDYLARVQKALAELPGVHEVEVNPLTGSILLHHGTGDHDSFRTRLARFAGDAGLFTLQDPESSEIREFADDFRTESEYLASRSKAAEAIMNEVRKANLTLKKASDNTLDFNVLVPVSVAVFSAATIGIGAATPLWVTLAIFSFHSFVSLHTQSNGANSGGPRSDSRTEPGPQVQPQPQLHEAARQPQ